MEREGGRESEKERERGRERGGGGGGREGGRELVHTGYTSSQKPVTCEREERGKERFKEGERKGRLRRKGGVNNGSVALGDIMEEEP